MTNAPFQGLSVDTLEAEARQIAGMEDFGDPAYRAGLTTLLSAYTATARFNRETADTVRAMLVDILVQRLRTEARLSQAGEGVPPIRPWFILGMPRSGTTALHRLLCAPPEAQGLEHWIAVAPQPRPLPSAWGESADYRSTVQQIEALRTLSPQLFTQHATTANDVDECRLILMQDFATTTFPSNATIPAYEDWLLSADVTASFRRHKRILGMIAAGEQRRWVLKDPCHCLFPDQLLRVYPDIRVIRTRRPAIEALPSLLTLVYESRRQLEPNVSAVTVGRATLALWSSAAHRLEAWRKDNPAVPWIDIDQSTLLRDPIGQVHKVYSAFGETLTAAGEGAVAEVAAGGLHGGSLRDRPRLEDFGLSADEVAAAFPLASG